MNILFIEKKLRTDKLGIMYIAGELVSKGHKVYLIQDDIHNAEEYLLSNKVDYIMYSVMTGEHNWFINRNKELKSKFNFKAVVGGPHFTYFPEQGIEDSNIDYIVQGPGEAIINNLVCNKYTDKLIFGHIPVDINQIEPPYRQLQYKYNEFGKNGIKRFITSRDCRGGCSYCYNALFNKMYTCEKDRLFQRVSVENTIKEILDVKQKYGIELVYFNDDDFFITKSWVLDFCKEYRKKVNLPFTIAVKARHSDEELLTSVKENGCVSISLALESAVKSTQKLLKRTDYNEQIKFVIDYCNKINLNTRIHNMIGLPLENSLEDAYETLFFNQELNPTDSWASIFQPFPKTGLWKYSIEHNYIDENTDCTGFFEETKLNLKDKDKINTLVKLWYFAVKYKWDKEFIDIILEQVLSNNVRSKLQDLRWEKGEEFLYGK